MQMNPRQIEAFRAVMLTGSMSVAAGLLKITQPAVSRLIKDLEAEAKFLLFRRAGNRLVPTHEASILFTEVDRFYVGMERIDKIVNDLRHAKMGSLRIASIGALSLSCITQAITTFHATRPAVEVALESLNTHQTLDLVAGRHFDVGFAQMVGEFPGVDLTPLPPVDAVCVMPTNFSIAAKETVEPADLQGVPFISLARNNPQRIKVDQVFEERGVKRQLLLETSLAASAIALVSSGLGVTIVDPFTATYLRNESIVSKPFKPSVPFEIAAATPAQQQNSRLCHDFIGIMRELFKKQRFA